MGQLDKSPDAVIGEQARQQAEKFEQEMEKIEAKLETLSVSPRNAADMHDSGPDRNEVHDLLKNNLHRIDFGDVGNAVQQVLNRDHAGGRAGLLVLENSALMRGDLGAQRVHDQLKSECGELLRRFSFRFTPTGRNDSGALLHYLAAELDLDLDGCSDAQKTSVVSRGLCGSLQTNSMVLFDIGACNLLVDDDPAALQWLIDGFWRPLLADLDRVARELPGTVTVIVLLLFDKKLPQGLLPKDYRCSWKRPSRDKLALVRLKKWTPREVADWLAGWGMRGQSNDGIQATVDNIMNLSGGMPDRIANQLMEHCLSPPTPRC
jgi:hypothetical protein